jgi:hypothetical protein
VARLCAFSYILWHLSTGHGKAKMVLTSGTQGYLLDHVFVDRGLHGDLDDLRLQRLDHGVTMVTIVIGVAKVVGEEGWGSDGLGFFSVPSASGGPSARGGTGNECSGSIVAAGDRLDHRVTIVKWGVVTKVVGEEGRGGDGLGLFSVPLASGTGNGHSGIVVAGGYRGHKFNAVDGDLDLLGDVLVLDGLVLNDGVVGVAKTQTVIEWMM